MFRPTALLTEANVSDMLQTGMEWMTAKRKAYASTSGILTVSGTPVSVGFTLAKRPVEVLGEGGGTMLVETMTAIISIVDMGTVRPKNGDKLSTGTGIDFEVRTPVAGAAAWEWCDAHHTAIRVFLRERNAELAPG